jgi:predicted metal-dependent hydrolase
MSTIKVRRFVDTVPENVERFWFKGNPYTTSLLNAFHLVFPPGEEFFIRSVKACDQYIQDPELKKKVREFIGQEVHHSRAHEEFWAILRSQGYDIDTILQFHDKYLYGILEPYFHKFFGGTLPLSVTAAAEHFTASFADAALSHPEVFDGVDPYFKNLFLWHAIEELEHKSVAYDVLKATNPDYFPRAAGMVLGTVLITFVIASAHLHLMVQEKNVSIIDWLKSGFQFYTMPGNPVVAGVQNLLDYFRIDFHPTDKDNIELTKKFVQILEDLKKVA